MRVVVLDNESFIQNITIAIIKRLITVVLDYQQKAGQGRLTRTGIVLRKIKFNQFFEKKEKVKLISSGSIIACHTTEKLVEYRLRAPYSNFRPTTHLTIISRASISSGLGDTFGQSSIHKN